METPAGMVYIDTRRQDGLIWVRAADFIPPNIHQFTANDEVLAARNSIGRPRATFWAGPLDDENTMQIGYWRAPEGKTVRNDVGFGQDGSRSHDERQRVPGDYDAQISIHNGMARHGLEHLATTDRGIIMMRNMIRRAIRANGAGEVLDSPLLRDGENIPTYSQDRVVSGVVPAATHEADRQLIRQIARNAVSETVARGFTDG
jgi:hypothetical protein